MNEKANYNKELDETLKAKYRTANWHDVINYRDYSNMFQCVVCGKLVSSPIVRFYKNGGGVEQLLCYDCQENNNHI